MMDAERPRRSRFGWPTATEPTTTPAGTHDHRVKNGPIGMALVGIVLLFMVNVGLVGYVLLARESRDEQNRKTNERITESICDLLDQFPEGGWLERPRQEYDCGPGIPIDRLTPEEQQKLSDRAPRQNVAPEPEPTPPATPAPFSGGAVGPPATSTQTPPPPRATPSPASPTPAPLLGPLTDTACAVTGVCLEGAP